MKEDKFIMVSLNDKRMKSLSEVLGNKTCKKIIEYLAENKEASEKDLSDAIKVQINTVEYNLRKLLESGFIQKRKNFFWSKKGKKILMYEITNKLIIISPKRFPEEKIKSILPSVILLFAGTFALWAYEKIIVAGNSVEKVYTANPTIINNLANANGKIENGTSFSVLGNPLWFWFLIGGLFVLFVFSIVNWRKL